MRERISTDNAARLTELTRVQCGWITQVAWSPDGTTLAVAGAEGVELYAGTFGGKPSHSLSGHTGHVKGLAFSPDNRLLASISADTTVKIWDLTDQHVEVRLVTTLEGHSDSVNAVAFSPDGQMLATGSADGLVWLWDTGDFSRKAVLEGHDSEVESVSFALRGNILVSAGRDNVLRVWDTRAETGGAVLGQHSDWIREVAANPPGTMIASASKDMTVRLWDAHSGDPYATIQAHNAGADCIAFNTYGEVMATGGRDNAVRLWHVQQVLHDGQGDASSALITLEAHEKPVMSLTFNPPGTLLATGSGDNMVRLWAVD